MINERDASIEAVSHGDIGKAECHAASAVSASVGAVVEIGASRAFHWKWREPGIGPTAPKSVQKITAPGKKRGPAGKRRDILDVEDQLRNITNHQRIRRQRGEGEKIHSIEKSKRDAETAWRKRIRDLDDLYDEYDD